MTEPVAWVIYYPDGTTFSAADGPPERSPPHPIIGVCQPSDVLGREICHGDWYCFRADLGRWTFHDREGALASMVYRGHLISCVRPGWFVADPAKWAALLDRMRRDKNGLPHHSAFPPVFRRE